MFILHLYVNIHTYIHIDTDEYVYTQYIKFYKMKFEVPYIF